MPRKLPVQPVAEQKQPDPIIADIERFIRDTAKKAPIKSNNDNKDKNVYKHTKPLPGKSLVQAPPPKRKMREEQGTSTLAKQPKKSEKSVTRSSGKSSKSHTKSEDLQSANIRTLLKMVTCMPMVFPKKRRVLEAVTCRKSSKFQTITTIVNSRCDSRTVRNVIVKQEIIDLTFYDQNTHVMYMKFAKFSKVEEFTEESVDVLVQKVKTSETPNEMNQVLIFAPDVRIGTNQTCIDLTADSDDEESRPLIITSEKECAIKIIPFVENFLKIYEVIRKMVEVVSDVLGNEPQDDRDFHFMAGNFISKGTASVGYGLVDTLSNMMIKNLNLTRFLEYIALKLEQRYRLQVTPEKIGSYLHTMLDQNKGHCKSGFPKNLLTELKLHMTAQQVKQEQGAETIALFREEQLNLLRLQIEQYHDVERRQRQLMSANNLENAVGLTDDATGNESIDGNSLADDVDQGVKNELQQDFELLLHQVSLKNEENIVAD